MEEGRRGCEKRFLAPFSVAESHLQNVHQRRVHQPHPHTVAANCCPFVAQAPGGARHLFRRLSSTLVRRSIPPCRAGAGCTKGWPTGEKGVPGPELSPSICLCTGTGRSQGTRGGGSSGYLKLPEHLVRREDDTRALNDRLDKHVLEELRCKHSRHGFERLAFRWVAVKVVCVQPQVQNPCG